MTKHPPFHYMKPGPWFLDHPPLGPWTGNQVTLRYRTIDHAPSTYLRLLPELSYLGLVLLGRWSVDQRQGVTVPNRYS